MDEHVKPGEICRAYQPGAYLHDPDPACGHLWVLHSTKRGCAGCEAIAEAGRHVPTEEIRRALREAARREGRPTAI